MDKLSGLNSTPSKLKYSGAEPVSSGEQDKAAEVAKKFEALLLFTMMKSMRSSLTEDTLTGSEQQDMYREMMDREVAESIAESGDFGIQKMLESQLSPAAAKIEQKNNMDAVSATIPTQTPLSVELLSRYRILQSSTPD